jgi:hypothetical protein
MSMPPAGCEPAIPASEQPQAYSLDRAATGIDGRNLKANKIFFIHDASQLIKKYDT